MKSIRQKCENCGADLEIDHGKGMAFCPYCRSVFQLEDSDRPRENVRENRRQEERPSADDVRIKQLEFEHERLMHEAMLEEKEKKTWRMAVLLYVGALFVSYAVFSSTAFGAVLLFGGIALYLMRPGKKNQGAPAKVAVRNPSPAPAYYVVSSPKSKWVALLLCFFFGVFGVHYFYVGRIGMGLLYLFTFGFLGFGWLVDMIRILAGTFRDSNGLSLDT